jgi:hypothetical protein
MGRRRGGAPSTCDQVAYRRIYGRRRSPTCVCATCDQNELLNPVVITFVVGLVVLIGATILYWRISGELPWNLQWYTYAAVSDAIIGIITLVALILGILLTRINEDIAVSQAAITAVQTLLNTNYPYSRRFVLRASIDVPSSSPPQPPPPPPLSHISDTARDCTIRASDTARRDTIRVSDTACGDTIRERGSEQRHDSSTIRYWNPRSRVQRKYVESKRGNEKMSNRKRGNGVDFDSDDVATVGERKDKTVVSRLSRINGPDSERRSNLSGIGTAMTDTTVVLRVHQQSNPHGPETTALHDSIGERDRSGMIAEGRTSTMHMLNARRNDMDVDAGANDDDEEEEKEENEDEDEKNDGVQNDGVLGESGNDVEARADERNRQIMFESVMLDIIFQTIGLVLASQAVPSAEFVHMMARMFDRAFVRNGWRAKRPYVATSTQLFVEANFFPRARNQHSLRRSVEAARSNCNGCGCLCRGGTCCYGCTINAFLHPSAIVGLIIAVCMVGFTWWYWALLVDETAALGDQHEVYWTTLLTLVSVPTLFLLVYASIDSQIETDFSDVVGDDSLQMLLFSSYPESVTYYLQLRSCDAFAQRVQPPPTHTIDRTRQRVFESTFSTSLFQTIQQTLLTDTIPDSGSRADWYSNSLSNIWQYYWRRDQYNWAKILRNYIDRHYVR